MNTTLTKPRRYEFGFPYLDAQVLVEDYGDTVTIRATRDTFTEQRKIAFIRELAAEGFIDDSFKWFSLAGPETYLGVRWQVDFSWLELPPRVIARARRFRVGLEVGGLVTWVILVTALLRGGLH